MDCHKRQETERGEAQKDLCLDRYPCVIKHQQQHRLSFIRPKLLFFDPSNIFISVQCSVKEMSRRESQNYRHLPDLLLLTALFVVWLFPGPFLNLARGLPSEVPALSVIRIRHV